MCSILHVKPDKTFWPCTIYLWEITDDSFFSAKIKPLVWKISLFYYFYSAWGIAEAFGGVLQRTTPHIQCSYSTIQFIISIARQYCSTFYALLSVISKSSDYLSTSHSILPFNIALVASPFKSKEQKQRMSSFEH